MQETPAQFLGWEDPLEKGKATHWPGEFGPKESDMTEWLSLSYKGFGIVNKAEVNVFLEFSYFFYDPMDVGNLISSSSTF